MKRLLTFTAVILLTALLIIPQTACGSKLEPVSKDSFYFDTICSISIYDMEDMSDQKAEGVIDGAFKECKHYEDLLSKTRKGTDIYRINHAGGKPVECDPITIEAIQKGLDYCELSKGEFDITIGKATELYDFHGKNPIPPTREDLDQAMKCVDYHQVRLDGNRVTMGTPEGEIDLGAIAKGFIADKLCSYLEDRGVKSAIISLGGNVACLGDKGGKDFSIGIEKPYSNQSEIMASTPLSNGTIVTSGTYERYYKYKGKTYHHILSSETGMPVDTDVVGVSIRSSAGHSADCDGLSTTCLILGSREAKKLIESMDGYEALFILDGDKIMATDGFRYQAE